jgi:hypothetical protein
MERQDLDINNYDIYELLNIYQLPYFFTEDDFDKAKEVNRVILENRGSLDLNTIVFYNKAYTLIDCIRKYRETKKLQRGKYVSNVVDDTQLIDKIKVIEKYDTYDNIAILTKIMNDNFADKLIEPLKLDKVPEVITSHPLNPPDKTVFTNTFPNKVVGGSINSIRRVVQYKNIHLNSCFREKYYNSNPCDFNYIFPSEIKNIVSLRLASIEIPNSWYLFSHIKKNNRFKIEMNICDKCFVFNIVVPDGNYDSDTLVAYLNKTYFSESKTDTNLKYIKISINELNFKTRFELLKDAPSKTKFTLHFVEENTNNLMDTLGWALGFRLGKYVDINEQIQSEGLFDGGGDRYIFFCLNDYQYNKNESNLVCFEETSIEEDVLAKIPMINGKLCLIVNDNATNSFTKVRSYNGPITLKKFHIRVLDKFGDIINLNNMDFSFTLELEILYERNNIV